MNLESIGVFVWVKFTRAGSSHSEIGVKFV